MTLFLCSYVSVDDTYMSEINAIDIKALQVLEVAFDEIVASRRDNLYSGVLQGLGFNAGTDSIDESKVLQFFMQHYWNLNKKYDYWRSCGIFITINVLL